MASSHPEPPNNFHKMPHAINTDQVSLEVMPHWPKAVRERVSSLAADDSEISARVEVVNQALSSEVRSRLLRQAMSAQGVMVYEQEAQIIGRAIGVKPKTPNPDVTFDVGLSSKEEDSRAKAEALTNEFFGVPCTFLVDGSCSIYEDRPMNCRLQINMDEDSTLCELVPGDSIPVPYLNVESSRTVYAMVMARKSDGGSRMADLRHYFPNGKSSV